MIRYLESQIEEVRNSMYSAYLHNPDIEKVLTISQELDVLLNQLIKLKANSV
ncbi:aspartyl-phosphate phosphatase Spo0E family protein [Aquibacillus kalidii]|uniref:aspartyl-phosphate phosphatase Spo0E family protein n=1 Tax=Aquibacillus kalidii TaxID=2762597 RepID=UPI002E286BED|nr:aspartyl-phosphate phosphatase Spo0E family protein [Aquibacillus kalidii]